MQAGSRKDQGVRHTKTRAYVSFPNGTHNGGCGHQHETARAAFNCGGNAYEVERSKKDKDGNVRVGYREVYDGD